MMLYHVRLRLGKGPTAHHVNDGEDTLVAMSGRAEEQ